jgi:hypothetical protein
MNLRPLAFAALTSLAALSAAVPLPATAGYNIWTDEYTVTRSDLQAQIEKRFPASLRYLQLIDVQLAHPRLTLDAANNRLSVTADVTVRNPFLKRPLLGVLAISSGLVFDPQALAVRMNDPSAERIEVEGLAPRDAQQLQAIGAVVAQELLRDYPLHTFKPADLKWGPRTFHPGAITVQVDGIKVQLE